MPRHRLRHPPIDTLRRSYGLLALAGAAFLILWAVILGPLWMNGDEEGAIPAVASTPDRAQDSS
jgi:hypothetical protein